MYPTMPRLSRLCLRFGRYLRPFVHDTTYRMRKFVSWTVGKEKRRVGQHVEKRPLEFWRLTCYTLIWRAPQGWSCSYSRFSVSIPCSLNDWNFFKRERICLSKDCLGSSALFKETQKRSFVPPPSPPLSFSKFRRHRWNFSTNWLLLEYLSPKWPCLLPEQRNEKKEGNPWDSRAIQKCPLTLSSSYLSESTSFISFVRSRRRRENHRLRFFDPRDSMEIK